jgi:hypothetical protein
MKCITCGKEQHHCSSCGYDTYLDNGYCNISCFEKSGEFSNIKAEFMAILDRLDDDAKRCLMLVLESYDSRFMDYYLRWIKETKNGCDRESV